MNRLLKMNQSDMQKEGGHGSRIEKPSANTSKLRTEVNRWFCTTMNLVFVLLFPPATDASFRVPPKECIANNILTLLLHVLNLVPLCTACLWKAIAIIHPTHWSFWRNELYFPDEGHHLVYNLPVLHLHLVGGSSVLVSRVQIFKVQVCHCIFGRNSARWFISGGVNRERTKCILWKIGNSHYLNLKNGEISGDIRITCRNSTNNSCHLSTLRAPCCSCTQMMFQMQYTICDFLREEMQTCLELEYAFNGHTWQKRNNSTWLQSCKPTSASSRTVPFRAVQKVETRNLLQKGSWATVAL